MESRSSFRTQVLWALAIILAFMAYRWYTGGGPDAVDIAARQQEMQDLWYRIPAPPGVGEPSQQVTTGPARVIIERTYPGKSDYATVSNFYQKELPAAAWQYVGEQERLPGFATPIQVFRNGDYHLLIYLTDNSVRLRMTFSLDRAPLVEAPKS